jgi:hypothetical protein
MRKMMRLEKHVNAYKPIANHVANIQYEKQKKVCTLKINLALAPHLSFRLLSLSRYLSNPTSW